MFGVAIFHFALFGWERGEREREGSAGWIVVLVNQQTAPSCPPPSPPGSAHEISGTAAAAAGLL